MAAQDGRDVLGDGGGQPVAALRCTDVPALGAQLAPLRHELMAWASTTGMTDDQVDSLVLAADEAVSNVVCHAYDPARPGTFDLYATHHPDQNAVRITVQDHGNWRSGVKAGLLHGRGLVLMRMLAHEIAIDHSEGGTTVRMEWLLA